LGGLRIYVSEQMNEKQQTGNEGERAAAEYLHSLGYEVLETNWRHSNQEIDIIARDKTFLVVAEVKTRTSTMFGEPEVFVNRQKQRNLIKAANAYLEKKNLLLECRFDILSVLKNGERYQVKHIQNAFYPILNKS
jgi:putative endonuclease